MKFTMTAIALALAGTTMTAAPAMAQDAEEQAAPAIELSKKGRKALAPLQNALNAKDYSELPKLMAEAEANASTSGDKYTLAQLKLKYAVDTGDADAMVAAADMMRASGAGDPMVVQDLYVKLGSMRYNDGDYAGAKAQFLKALEIKPDDSNAMYLLAETSNMLDDVDGALRYYGQAIATQKASGNAIEENWYRRAVGIAYDAGRRETANLTREWLVAYPTDANWGEALAIYHNSANHPDPVYLDLYRLRHAVGALKRSQDYADFAGLLILANSPSEALVVLNEGQAAGLIEPDSLRNKELFAAAKKGDAAAERATLDTDASRAGSRDSARAAFNIGNAYYGYGEFQKAADMYRIALTKSDVDRDITQLRLGMALARAGDKAGAKEALAKVGGAQAELAKYWMIYADTRG
ncbi:tetratricopeptide repeat protein [Sphingomicrobium lutaoense]|uniref:Tetratricopeptide (TPR) repeat protein n=1 Tax=Sphingomicrobium lutaoense TaxID=515949 RepID=A0A839YU04_9SPHN|nr:tetratricopeptide repeat protein [Sphingomicrobium lutaoense]MBB3763741.1 tetratricopeptide (TPR) repeat protein [Sphingomicrobium lutaoense]